jgi:GNAT superfamily N-acetyltransferase
VADWVIERLRRDHDRDAFCCGNEPLDRFLSSLVGQYERKRLGRTFVATEPGGRRVLGYYTASAGSFALDLLDERARGRLPRHPLPTVHLGRLAVDRSCPGRGLGEALLFHFLRRALDLSMELGVYAVDLRALDPQARSIYLRYGFLPLEDTPLHLYLPMATVQAMFSG